MAEDYMARGRPECWISYQAILRQRLQHYRQGVVSLPMAFKSCGRYGLWNAFDLDITKSHFHAQLDRHPSGMPLLLKYIQNKEDTRQAVVDATGCSKDEATQLLIQLMYSGSVSSWCREYQICETTVPGFVHKFGEEQRDILAKDTSNNLPLLTAIRASGAKRPEVTLESYLIFWGGSETPWTQLRPLQRNLL